MRSEVTASSMACRSMAQPILSAPPLADVQGHRVALVVLAISPLARDRLREGNLAYRVRRGQQCEFSQTSRSDLSVPRKRSSEGSSKACAGCCAIGAAA
jgi:hypothetical protein